MTFFYLMYDWTYILVIIGALLCVGASALVNGTFARYSGVQTSRGITGAGAAKTLLNTNGIYIPITRISGSLTDHYDPSQKTLSLSDPVFGQTSISAVAVAAHECGHALQDDQSYLPLRFRTALVPVVNFGATISWPLIFIGFLLNGNISVWLLDAGTILFSLVLLFQLVTLPVEFNASSRALHMLDNEGILTKEEMAGARKVLVAAAMTYVASVASSALQLLRLLILIGGKNSSND